MKRIIYLSFIIVVLFPFMSCKKESFAGFVKNKNVLSKAVVLNYPESDYPKTIYGFKSYNIIRKRYLFEIPLKMRKYGIKDGDSVSVIDEIKFKIHSNMYHFYLVEKDNKYVYINSRCIKKQ